MKLFWSELDVFQPFKYVGVFKKLEFLKKYKKDLTEPGKIYTDLKSCVSSFAPKS